MYVWTIYSVDTFGFSSELEKTADLLNLFGFGTFSFMTISILLDVLFLMNQFKWSNNRLHATISAKFLGGTHFFPFYCISRQNYNLSTDIAGFGIYQPYPRTEWPLFPTIILWIPNEAGYTISSWCVLRVWSFHIHLSGRWIAKAIAFGL